MDIRAFLRWVNEGDAVWEDAVYRRRVLLPALREMIVRLELAPEYDRMRREAMAKTGQGHGDRYGQAPRESLLVGILSNLRVHGYVYPVGPVPDGRSRPMFERTPLTGRQLHMVRMYAWGATTLEISKELHLYTAGVRERMVEARRETGTSTVTQLVACCYRNDWFPGHAEYQALLRGRHLGRGYTIIDQAQEADAA